MQKTREVEYGKSMSVNEVEGEVVVNLLQGEIRMRMDGGISDYQMGTCISMGMWRYPVINNNRVITGSYIPSAGEQETIMLCIIIMAIWIASTCPNWESQQRALLHGSSWCFLSILLIQASTMSFLVIALNYNSPVCTAKPARGE